MTDQWLYLFTSNIREQYIADAIDLLAAPEGFVYQFRYAEAHVQDEMRAHWGGPDQGLKGRKLLVLYSLQHAANFHPAAYVPLRTGEVVDSFIEGKTYVVKFKLSGYAPLPAPAENTTLDKRVHDFSDAIRALLEPSYPDYSPQKEKRRSASAGPSPEALFASSVDGGARFEAVVDYMSAALEPEPRIFYRVTSVWRRKRSSKQELSDDGYLDLTAGNEYVLEVNHYQVESRESAVLQISAMPGIHLLTPEELQIRSRYDVMPIRFFAPFRDDEVQGELTLSIKEPAKGANVRIPVRIRPSLTHAVGSPFVAVLGGVLAVVPTAAGTGASVEEKVFLAFVGAFLLGLSAVGRRSKGLTNYR